MPEPRTRIVATLGPATDTADVLRALCDAGVDVFRINLAHGTPDEHARRIETIRRAAAGRPVAVLADLAGPKFRLERPLDVRPGEVVALRLPDGVEPGDPVLVADGAIRLEVVDRGHCRAVTGGRAPAGKGMNFPASRLDVPAVTARDLELFECVAERGVEFAGVSFVRRAQDLDPVRRFGVGMIAKIETAPAVENASEILSAADAVMIARGDLGVEIPIERLPVVQKRLIAAARARGTPVITATQMLVSMVEHPLPTRAEATDVANAVWDGTDAVMLSEETAVGRYPVDAVRTMARILAEAESAAAPAEPPAQDDPQDAVARAAVETARRIGAAAIVAPTISGASARRVARWRPAVPILALVPDEKVRRQLAVVYGVRARAAPWYGTPGADVMERLRACVREEGDIPAGARIVVLAGLPYEQPGVTNLIHVACV